MNLLSNHCQNNNNKKKVRTQLSVQYFECLTKKPRSFLKQTEQRTTREINIFLRIQVRNMWSFKLIVGTKLNSNEISFVSQAYLLMTVVKLAMNFISGVTVTLSTDIGQRL